MLHGSGGILTAVHCFRIVLSMASALEACISVWLIATPEAARLCHIPGRPIRRPRLAAGTAVLCFRPAFSFWQNELEFMNENNSASKLMCVCTEIPALSARTARPFSPERPDRLLDAVEDVIFTQELHEPEAAERLLGADRFEPRHREIGAVGAALADHLAEHVGGRIVDRHDAARLQHDQAHV